MIIELHAHTKENSACGHVGIVDLIEKYRAKGYDAVVITDHLNDWTVGIKDADKDWDGFVDKFYSPVREGREYAEKYGMRIFFGCEMRFENDENDYLVYGITPELLKANPDIRKTNIEKFHELAQKNGFLVFQAHPFRDNMKITPVKHLDGIEVNNGNPRQSSRNDFARLWADTFGLRMISGSDFHEDGDEGVGGIITARDIKDEKELCELLLSGEYLLISDPAGGLLKNNR